MIPNIVIPMPINMGGGALPSAWFFGLFFAIFIIWIICLITGLISIKQYNKWSRKEDKISMWNVINPIGMFYDRFPFSVNICGLFAAVICFFALVAIGGVLFHLIN